MKNVITLCIATLLMSCAQSNPEGNNANTQQITKPNKTNVVTDNTTKIEILLDKGGKVTFESQTNITRSKNKKYLDRVTLYRIIASDDSDFSTDWMIDTKSPLTKIDTTFLFCGDNGLKKLQYHQGYISAIYQ